MACEPATRRSRSHRPNPRARYAAGTAALLAGGLGYVALVDPHNTESVYPLCPFKWLTGWNCPFCGGLRMTHDLMHGHLMASVSDNVFLLVGLPLLAGWVLLGRRHDKSSLSTPAVLIIAVATALWTVVRNLPGFPLVPPLSG